MLSVLLGIARCLALASSASAHAVARRFSAAAFLRLRRFFEREGNSRAISLTISQEASLCQPLQNILAANARTLG